MTHQVAAGGRRRLSHGLHSDSGASLAQGPARLSACCAPEGDDCRRPDTETSSDSIFMPEFPQCQAEEQDRFQVVTTQEQQQKKVVWN